MDGITIRSERKVHYDQTESYNNKSNRVTSQTGRNVL